MTSLLKKTITLQKSHLYGAFLTAFFLPLSIKISNVFLILFFASAFGLVFFNKSKLQNINYKLLYYTLLPLFIISIIGLLYSDPLLIGSSKIAKSISFLLCPIILLFYNKDSLQTIKKELFRGIILGCVLTFLVLLSFNFYGYYATRPFLLIDDELLNYYYTYYSFTKPLGIHPTYLGTYALLAIAILLTHFKKFSKYRRVLVMVMIAILSLGILFLNSRVVFLLYALLIGTTMLVLLRQWYLKKKFLLFFIMIAAIGAGGFFSHYLLSETFIVTRMTKELSWELSDQKDSNYNLNTKADSRIARWKSAVQVIKEKPIFGYGTKMEKTVLNKQFIEDGLLSSAKKRYDSHNMYLSVSLEYGALGLLLFLIYLMTNLYYAVLKKRALTIFFFVIITVVCLFENYLALNAGITFVGLFGSVLSYINLKD
ncbi:MAG: O-antigen ligase [Patiriisocius sp.]|jgi:O-antigen ligase